jgi:hypothetical protein
MAWAGHSVAALLRVYAKCHAGQEEASTMIGCENVPIATWLEEATSAEIDGDTLVLRDATGAETGRLVPLR